MDTGEFLHALGVDGNSEEAWREAQDQLRNLSAEKTALGLQVDRYQLESSHYQTENDKLKHEIQALREENLELRKDLGKKSLEVASLQGVVNAYTQAADLQKSTIAFAANRQTTEAAAAPKRFSGCFRCGEDGHRFGDCPFPDDDSRVVARKKLRDEREATRNRQG